MTSFSNCLGQQSSAITVKTNRLPGLLPSPTAPHPGMVSAFNRRSRHLHSSDICLPASRMTERNQTCAASVFIRGCQDMRYLNLPSTSGAFRIFSAGLEASNSAIRLGTVATKVVPARLRIAVVW